MDNREPKLAKIPKLPKTKKAATVATVATEEPKAEFGHGLLKENAVKKSQASKDWRPWTPEEKIRTIDLYIEGKSLREIGTELGRGEKSIRKLLDTYHFSMTNMKVTRMLPMMNKKDGTKAKVTPRLQKEWDTLQNPELINKAFFELLSPPTADGLTEQEIKFCWAYISSLDLNEAIFAAGLDAGLYEEDKANPAKILPVKGFDACLKMRIAYLKTKPNIAVFIKRLRKEAVFNVEVDKDFLQKEIMTQIEGLRIHNTMEAKKLMRDYITMLGRTFGGFTDKVEIEEIDHGNTIAKLSAAAKEIEARGLNVEAAKAEAVLLEAAKIREKEARSRKYKEQLMATETDSIQ